MSETSIVGIIFCCIGLLVPVIFGTIALFILRRLAATRSWAPTTGQVVSSRIVLTSSGEGTSESPEVIYSYRIMGQEYQSSRIQVGGMISGTGARKVVNRYPIGSTVQLFYDPNKPNDSVLERKSNMLWFLSGMGLLFFLIFGLVGVGLTFGDVIRRFLGV